MVCLCEDENDVPRGVWSVHDGTTESLKTERYVGYKQTPAWQYKRQYAQQWHLMTNCDVIYATQEKPYNIMRVKHIMTDATQFGYGNGTDDNATFQQHSR